MVTAVSHEACSAVALYLFCSTCAAGAHTFLPEFRLHKFGISPTKSTSQVPTLRELGMRSVVIGMANDAPGVDALTLKRRIPEPTRGELLSAYLDFIRLREGAFRQMLVRKGWADGDIGSLDFASTGVRSSELKALQYFCKSIRLNHLSLCWNRLGKEGAARMRSILSSDNIVRLDLAWTRLGSHGATTLAQAMGKCRRLLKLDLSGNKIDADGAFHIAHALAENEALEELVLAFNSIGSIGAGAIARALVCNQTLSRLDLRGNCIGAEGAKAFAQLFRVNPKLKDINLLDNEIGPEGAAELAKYYKGTIPQLIQTVYRPNPTLIHT